MSLSPRIFAAKLNVYFHSSRSMAYRRVTREVSLESHLDRRIVLNENPEFKSLYKWSLQEQDKDGAQIGPDLIPWDWSLIFTATELLYSEGLTIKPGTGGEDHKPPTGTKIRRFIQGNLRPGRPHEWHPFRQTSYSMLGTERTIDTFQLFIEAISDKGGQDRCAVWGSVSYTSDIDFRDETSDDTIIFYLYVQPETFEHYVRLISAAQVDTATLFLRSVAGFYSAWSPGISTSRIKVLTNYETDHAVESASGSKIVPPRLGEVGEASLTLQRKLTFENPLPDPSDDDGWRDEFPETPPDMALVAAQQSANANKLTVTLLTSLRTALWAVAALLFLILVT